MPNQTLFTPWTMLGAIMLSGLALAAAPAGKADLTPDAINQRIQQHRTANATLTLTTPDGKPLANAAVTLRQTRHKFLFGCNAFAINTADASESQQLYQKRFAELLNFATLPFYWGAFERAENQPGTDRVKAMAAWCNQNNIRTKGHPLCWQQVAPRWLLNKPVDEVEKLQLARITREVAAFQGAIDTWDVVNEAVIMPDYKTEQTPIPALCKKLGQVELIKRTFAVARAANPSGALILNDYDTSPKYERLIEDCLAAGVPIDIIGIQSHMHGNYWGAEQAWNVCQRFSRFNKPLHFTELTILSADPKPNQRWNGPRYEDWLSTPEGEQRQAQRVAEFYTILFSHPSVHAITWWDFSDNGAWLGAPSGLVRKDMSPKPAYDALMKLVKRDWWTAEVKATTDANGKLNFRGFLGEYVVEAAAGKAGFSMDQAGQCQTSAVIK